MDLCFPGTVEIARDCARDRLAFEILQGEFTYILLHIEVRELLFSPLCSVLLQRTSEAELGFHSPYLAPFAKPLFYFTIS